MSPINAATFLEPVTHSMTQIPVGGDEFHGLNCTPTFGLPIFVLESSISFVHSICPAFFLILSVPSSSSPFFCLLRDCFYYMFFSLPIWKRSILFSWWLFSDDPRDFNEGPFLANFLSLELKIYLALLSKRDSQTTYIILRSPFLTAQVTLLLGGCEEVGGLPCARCRVTGLSLWPACPCRWSFTFHNDATKSRSRLGLPGLFNTVDWHCLCSLSFLENSQPYFFRYFFSYR